MFIYKFKHYIITMVTTDNLLSAAKDVMKFVFVAFMTYFAAIIVWIILGFFQESVVPGMGLNATGTAVTAINTLITAIGTALTSITAIVTVITGLLSLNVVLKAFGIQLNMNFGSGKV